MSNSKKVLLIGWDAADWKIIHHLIDIGYMPTVQKMVENGVMGNMRTLTPVLSPMLWTSIATGKRPFKHGIYGFSEPTPDGKFVQPMTNVSRKSKAIWNILNQNDLQSIVVGWWPSHPAEPINGAMVSDYYSKAPKKPGDPWELLPKCIHPARLYQEIAELRVHQLELKPEHILPFVPHGHDVDQETDHRLSVMAKLVAECTTVHAAATHLLENEPWDFAAVYYDSIDHFCHGFMKYHPPQQKSISDQDFRLFSQVVTAAYVYHDMILKRLLELAGDDTTVILMSDHGFHPDHLRPTTMPTEPAGPATEHRDFGIFVASGPGIKHDHIIHGANLLDVAPTILSIYGLPLGEDMDGQPLVDIFETEPEIKTIPSWEDVDGDDGQHPKDMVINPQESKAALEQLIALGYIERPDADSKKAVAQCTRELDYNLARAYMDAGMYGEAIPLLLDLYRTYPLEFRFGIQLANCLKAKDQTDDLERLVDDLNSRWRVASEEAKNRISEISKIARNRKTQWLEMKKVDEQNKDDPSNPPKLARVGVTGKPVLFNESETSAIRRLRAVARGNPQTLDFLAATIATSKGDFETALHFLEKAELTKSKNPEFQFHLGNVYMGLDRYEDAEQVYAKALELDEFNPNGLMGLCRVNLEMGRADKALEFGKQAVGLKFHFPIAHYYLGRARRRTGDYEGAIKSLTTAIEQNPNFTEAHDLLSRIYSTSHPDQELSKYHASAVRELARENAREVEASEPIELPEFEAADFRDQLPEVDDSSENTEEFVRSLAQTKIPSTDTSGTVEKQTKEIIVVSGLPRSGTSVMMQMLVAGGLEAFTDENRLADESNPKGYYEADIAKQLPRKNNWLLECEGKVVKIVAPLIPYLPQAHRYKVIFMNREIEEIIGSQHTMLQRLDKSGGNIEDERLETIFSQQAHYANNLLRLHNHPVVKFEYHDVISDPESVAAKLAEFLELDLDVQAIAAVVDPSLYRQRVSAKN